MKIRMSLIDQATPRLKSGSCLIDQTALFQSGNFLNNQAVPEFNQAAA